MHPHSGWCTFPLLRRSITQEKPRNRITYEQRVLIEDMLNRKLSLYRIAKELNRSASTISREIRSRRVSYRSNGNDCGNKRDCHLQHACGSMSCTKLCKKCIRCKKHCPDYIKNECKQLLAAPYVCNGCTKLKFGSCTLDHYVYNAANAQKNYKELLVERRSGFDLTLEELEKINALVSPLIKNGQSPYHIIQTLQDQLSISESTLRRLIDSCELDARNIDLRNKVKRKQRKHNKTEKKPNISKTGRLYQDYLTYIEETDCSIVEMDCVEGKKEETTALLTLHFPQYKLQLVFIMDEQTSENVIRVLDMIEETLGKELFRFLFSVILTDNGHEFTNISGMERSIYGGKRTKIFFCEPNRSDEKGHCENNHKYIRYIIPKGTSLEPYNQSDISLMMDHINSYKRKSLFGKSPYEAAKSVFPEDFFLLLGLELVPPEQVTLQPRLLKKSHISDKMQLF